MQAYSHIKFQASCYILGSHSSVPDKSIFCKISSGSVTLCEVPSDRSAWTDIHYIFSFSAISGSLGICIDGTMLAVVTIPASVCGSEVTSLPDKFLSTTVTPESPGINSEVFPVTNTPIHLEVGSTNTWTPFWSHVTFVCEPFCDNSLKSGYFHFLGYYQLAFYLFQVKFLIIYLWYLWYDGNHIC